jgi:hypothetical protein
MVATDPIDGQSIPQQCSANLSCARARITQRARKAAIMDWLPGTGGVQNVAWREQDVTV